MSESEGEQEWTWRQLLPDWLRRGRKANLARIPVEKLDKAARERGVVAEIVGTGSGRVEAEVSKVVVKGDDS